MTEVNERNPIDVNAQGLIGKPLDRIDGPLKVTGQAKYSYEYQLDGKPATYGFIVNATIAKGRIEHIDTKVAESAPGVHLVMTYKNAPKQKDEDPKAKDNFASPKPYLHKPDIRYFGEPVALVVADTYEAARAAAALVNVRYAETPGAQFHVAPNKDRATAPKTAGPQSKPDSKLGNFEKAFAAAPVKIDSTYTTPYQNHNAMEPHASLAVWNGDNLVIYSAQQLPASAQQAIANTFGINKKHVRIVCKFIGGGFGGKLPVLADAILAAGAAKLLGRPVKVAMTRQQTFPNVTHRPESIQRIRLGAQKDGTLDAISHEVWLQTTDFSPFTEPAAVSTRSLYAAPNRFTSHRVIDLDVPPAGSMRAPGEAIGMLALEQAMDELAVALGMDPVALRIRNEPAEDPEKKIPFSTRALIPCMEEGARRFGWDKRPAGPGALRDGRWLIGYGMASAIRSNYLRDSAAKIQIDGNGHITAKLAMTDIGTGSYTILTQIAAEVMGVSVKSVTIDIGDTDFPPTPGSGGSFGANSAGSGLYNACMALREKLGAAAVKDKHSPLHGQKPEQAEFLNATIAIEGQSETLAALVARQKKQIIEADGKIKMPDTYKSFSQYSYGAHFAEVGIDSDTGEVRLRRMLGVFAAGRILNEKTAHSQAIGGLIWGVGSALHEEGVVDKRWGHFVNHDLAEYHVPVHADAVNIEAVFLPEIDDKTGPLKIKGVGELGICGAGAAIANAVYNACGVRVRDYPITLDKILPQLHAS